MSNGFEKMAAMQESTLREYVVGQAVNLIGRTVTAVLPVDVVSGQINTQNTSLYLEPASSSTVLKTLAKDTPVTILGKEGTMYLVKLADGTEGYINEASITIDKNPRLVGVVTGMKLIDEVPNVIINGRPIPISYIEEVNQTSTDSQAQGGAA